MLSKSPSHLGYMCEMRGELKCHWGAGHLCGIWMSLIWSRASRKRVDFIETSARFVRLCLEGMAQIRQDIWFNELGRNVILVKTLQVRITGLTILPPPGQMLGLPSIDSYWMQCQEKNKGRDFYALSGSLETKETAVARMFFEFFSCWLVRVPVHSSKVAQAFGL